MRILILGMGNPILSDDGVGLLVARDLQKKIHGANVAMSLMIGLNILDEILNYNRLFIIDAMISSGGTIGDVRIISELDCYGSLHLFSSHGLNIFELIDLGRRCGFPVPELGAVYGIEIGREVAFGRELSPGLQEHLPRIEREILSDMISREQSLSVRIAAS